MECTLDVGEGAYKIFFQRDADNGNDNSSDESDWEPEAEIMPPEREQTRSGRQRKRPSFFQVKSGSRK